MRIALCYWGLCRSTDKTYRSIEECIYKPLRQANIDFDIYLHTYEINGNYTNVIAKEKNIKLNNELYKLLKPTAFLIENQLLVDKQLNLQDYFTQGLCRQWKSYIKNHEEIITMTHNHIRALHSLKQVTGLWLKSEKTYDRIIYLRPDVKFLTKLDTNWLIAQKPDECILTNFAMHPVNDRFAILYPIKAKFYGERFDELLEFSKTSPVHSEGYLGHIINKHGIVPVIKNFQFRRVRANGLIIPN
jgi:hypothetical protein